MCETISSKMCHLFPSIQLQLCCHQIICTNFAETNTLLKCFSTSLVKTLLVGLTDSNTDAKLTPVTKFSRQTNFLHLIFVICSVRFYLRRSSLLSAGVKNLSC